jgi:hypothetical protein
VGYRSSRNRWDFSVAVDLVTQTLEGGQLPSGTHELNEFISADHGRIIRAMVICYEVPPMTYMLVLTGINVFFTLFNLAMGETKLAAFTALRATFCAVGALLSS